jgi:hypothetical protein
MFVKDENVNTGVSYKVLINCFSVFIQLLLREIKWWESYKIKIFQMKMLVARNCEKSFSQKNEVVKVFDGLNMNVEKGSM